jgi:hypothetical protein
MLGPHDAKAVSKSLVFWSRNRRRVTARFAVSADDNDLHFFGQRASTILQSCGARVY